MISQQQAEYLLNLPKHIIEDKKYIDSKSYAPAVPIDDRIFLGSREDDEFTFFIEIFQSTKNNLKMTLHCQEEDASVGLLRVDFNGRHRNPEIANDNVPPIFHPYAGLLLEESHIHYFVEGYKPLNWAMPLSADDSFPIKVFLHSSEIGSIILAYANKINLITQLDITIQTQII